MLSSPCCSFSHSSYRNPCTTYVIFGFCALNSNWFTFVLIPFFRCLLFLLQEKLQEWKVEKEHSASIVHSLEHQILYLWYVDKTSIVVKNQALPSCHLGTNPSDVRNQSVRLWDEVCIFYAFFKIQNLKNLKRK